MHKFMIAPMLAVSAMALAIASPASAESKGDRAQKAIAAAEGRIQAAQAAGVQSEMPVRLAKAREDLANAREAVSAGHKEDAIELANHASAEAEAVIAQSSNRKDTRAAAAVNQANTVADQASHETAVAQQQSANANARADSAEQSAAASAQQAQAAQQAAANAQAVAAANAVPPPAPAEVKTEVTTHTATGSTHRTVVKRKIRRAPAAHGSATSTTTTVTQKM